MSSQRRESTSQATARRWKSRIRRFLLVCFFLQLAVVGAGLYYTGNLTFIFPKKDTARHVKTLEKNIPIEEKEVKNSVILKINKTITQPQTSVTLKEPTEEQLNPAAQSIEVYLKESLPPELAPSLPAMNLTTEDTESSESEDDILATKNNVISGDVAEKSEEKTIDTGLPDSQKQQTTPVISQTDTSAVPAKSVVEGINNEPTGQSMYTVQTKDNLGLISQKVYGTPTKWRLIADANIDQLDNNPNRLLPGMVLVIPSLKAINNPTPSASLHKIE